MFSIFLCVGMLLNGAGTIAGLNGYQTSLAGFSSGAGCALIITGVIGMAVLKKSRGAEKQLEIDTNDERNVKIREKSAYSAFFITLFALTAAAVYFTAIENLDACFIIVILMAVHVLSYLIHLWLNNRKL